MNGNYTGLRQNEPGWKLNRFRTEALPSLRQDLKDRKFEGLEDHECKDVQNALASIIGLAKGSPKNSLNREEVIQSLDEFYDTYVVWNSFKPKTEEGMQQRMKAILKLRNKNREFARVVSLNQAEIGKNLTNDLVDAIFYELKKLVEAYSYFPNLKQVVLKYFS